jgi:hypothetical protein
MHIPSAASVLEERHEKELLKLIGGAKPQSENQ